jgi:hypothetical protein
MAYPQELMRLSVEEYLALEENIELRFAQPFQPMEDE